MLTTQLNHLTSLTKWLSVRLRTKWLWVRISLLSLKWSLLLILLLILLQLFLITHSFSWSTFFDLFKLILLLKLISLLSKSVFFTNLVISYLLAKFACANLTVEFYGVNLLNSWVVIYLAWSVVTFFWVSPVFGFF